MINNGTIHYDHDRDGTHSQVAGCTVSRPPPILTLLLNSCHISLSPGPVQKFNSRNFCGRHIHQQETYSQWNIVRFHCSRELLRQYLLAIGRYCGGECVHLFSVTSSLWNSELVTHCHRACTLNNIMLDVSVSIPAGCRCCPISTVTQSGLIVLRCLMWTYRLATILASLLPLETWLVGGTLVCKKSSHRREVADCCANIQPNSLCVYEDI